MSETVAPKSVAVELKEAAAPYVDAFESLPSNGNGQAPAWLQARRGAAMARFAEAGFPASQQEEWRSTDVKAIARTKFECPSASRSTPASIAEFVLGTSNRWIAVFVDGHFQPGLSALAGLPAGVRIGSLRDGLREDPGAIEPHLGKHAVDAYNPLAALNTGFLHDGGLLVVPRETVLEREVEFLYLTSRASGDVPPVTHPRNLYVVDASAQATVRESYVGPDDSVYWTNSVTETVIGENASLNVYRVQREGSAAYHTAATHSVQERNSNYSFITFTFGAAMSRHDIRAVLNGEGADATLDGLSMLRGRQHTDYHTILEHASPHCTSWEYFNGVFDDRSRGVFTGRIIVQPGAQKTDSKQTNNNLLLSPDARADSQPQLEIYADDVRCTHGATLGPIDDEHLFYLQSRGINAESARDLMTYGFGSEILQAVKSEELRDALDALVHDWLQQRTAARA
jgi:Fe-S cluster assembly protein SufD